jgi:hypothetical protein
MLIILFLRARSSKLQIVPSSLAYNDFSENGSQVLKVAHWLEAGIARVSGCTILGLIIMNWPSFRLIGRILESLTLFGG